MARASRIDQFLDARDKERTAYWGAADRTPPAPPRPASAPRALAPAPVDGREDAPGEQQAAASARASGVADRRPSGNGRTPRRRDVAPRRGAARTTPLAATAGRQRPSAGPRARRAPANASGARGRCRVPFPDRRLTRSAYEQVFLKLVSGGRLRMGSEIYTPVGMKGWYHAIFRRDSDGAERLLTIDQLLKKMNDWPA